MQRSLVGSEMCIRDSLLSARLGAAAAGRGGLLRSLRWRAPGGRGRVPAGQLLRGREEVTMSSRDVRQRFCSLNFRLLSRMWWGRRVLPRGEFGALEVPTGLILHRWRRACEPLSARHLWSDGCVRRRALQRALSARVLLSRGLCVTDGLSSGNLRRIVTFKRRGLHGAVSRGPLLPREQHYPRAVRRHDGGVGRLRQEAFLPGWCGSPASDTSRLLRYWRLPRGEIAGSAVRGGTPLPPRRAARVRAGHARTCDGRGGDPGRRGAVQALPSRSLLSAGDGRRETVPRGNVRQRYRK